MNSELQPTAALPSMDVEYRFGHPKLFLAPHELARLTILRSKLGDTQTERAAERIPVATRVAAAIRAPAVAEDLP